MEGQETKCRRTKFSGENRVEIWVTHLNSHGENQTDPIWTTCLRDAGQVGEDCEIRTGSKRSGNERRAVDIANPQFKQERFACKYQKTSEKADIFQAPAHFLNVICVRQATDRGPYLAHHSPIQVEPGFAEQHSLWTKQDNGDQSRVRSITQTRHSRPVSMNSCLFNAEFWDASGSASVMSVECYVGENGLASGTRPQFSIWIRH